MEDSLDEDDDDEVPAKKVLGKRGRSTDDKKSGKKGVSLSYEYEYEEEQQ